MTRSLHHEHEWLSYFDDRGDARHVPANSPRGRVVLADIVAETTRTCAVDDCTRPARPRSATCSEAHARQLRRAVRIGKRPRFGRKWADLPETPETRTSGERLPGMMRPAIADTADTFDPAARRCAKCGRDITTKRVGAVVCSDACRKAIARRAAQLARQGDMTELFAMSRSPR